MTSFMSLNYFFVSNRCDSASNASIDIQNYWWYTGFLYVLRSQSRTGCSAVHEGKDMISISTILRGFSPVLLQFNVVAIENVRWLYLQILLLFLVQLVGRTFMPPYWSLGFQLCRYGYKDLDEVKDVVSDMKKYGIPQVRFCCFASSCMLQSNIYAHVFMQSSQISNAYRYLQPRFFTLGCAVWWYWLHAEAAGFHLR